MNEPWRIAAALGLLASLAVALAWVVLDGGSGGAVPDTTTAAVAEAPDSVGPARSSSTVSPPPPPPPPPPPVPPTTEAFTTLPPVVLTVPPPPDEITLVDVLPAVEAALVAWGEFAVTGDLDLVATTFDRAGPQYAQLRSEAPALAADPLGPPPYVFTLSEASLHRPALDRAVVVGDVTLDRLEEPTQSFRWRIVMNWVGGEWLLWTVRDEGG